MGTSGVVKQRNQHYSNYWLTNEYNPVICNHSGHLCLREKQLFPFLFFFFLAKEIVFGQCGCVGVGNPL